MARNPSLRFRGVIGNPIVTLVLQHAPRKGRNERAIQARRGMLGAIDFRIRAMLVLKHLYHALGNDGETYEVHVYAESADTAGAAHIEKLKSVALSDGRALRVVSKGHYEVEDGSLKLESHDPEAI